MDFDKIEKLLKEKDISIIILPKNDYSENVMKIARIMAKLNNLICYISANKPEKTLVKMMDQNSIDQKKFIIIDCITETAEQKKGRTFYMKSPTNLTGVSLAVKEAVEMGAENFLFDAISTFMIYEQGIIVVRFAHNIITRLRESDKKCVFIVMEGDVNRVIIDDLDMFVDAVYEPG